MFTLAFTFHQDVHYKQSGKSDSKVKWRKEKTQQLPALAASILYIVTMTTGLCEASVYLH